VSSRPLSCTCRRLLKHAQVSHKSTRREERLGQSVVIRTRETCALLCLLLVRGAALATTAKSRRAPTEIR